MKTQLPRAIHETLELQAALRAIFEGETLKKEQRARSGISTWAASGDPASKSDAADCPLGRAEPAARHAK
ncbi:hypothetical protein SAMN02745121_07917 [Nannocystis exedens]|uniref:Uncharacterized protein n=1 Tax=Nannocystis exedens TaxID=54 RepID=A0A1I2HD74_9BACT|nr:hypothetical protein [Nannocystis exedens]PCC67882.1 hypothetical protein NAEX_00890 [Nannocystis exedens]SFF28185.1 hypothetical protein SAMN02745121_07917 [Nannocystis exedens]